MNTYASSSNRPREASTFKLVAVFLLLALCTVMIVPSAWSQESHRLPVEPKHRGRKTRQTQVCKPQPVLSTLVYLPLKLAFAIGGGIIGGLTYAFSGGNEEAAKSVWTTSLYGTYLITPDHLQGNRPIRFLGVADSNNTPAPASVPEPIR